jgi:UDP-N-acetylmuramoyl-tripeptide--D-alanyl-D-alanine ligase
MLELGDRGVSSHQKTGRLVKSLGLKLWATGPLSKETVKAAGTTATHFPDKESLGKALQKEIRRGDLVYLKASRGMKFETILEMWSTREGR